MDGKVRNNSCFDIFLHVSEKKTPITDYGVMSLTWQEVLTTSCCYANVLCMHRTLVWKTCAHIALHSDWIFFWYFCIKSEHVNIPVFTWQTLLALTVWWPFHSVCVWYIAIYNENSSVYSVKSSVRNAITLPLHYHKHTVQNKVKSSAVQERHQLTV